MSPDLLPRLLSSPPDGAEVLPGRGLSMPSSTFRDWVGAQGLPTDNRSMGALYRALGASKVVRKQGTRSVRFTLVPADQQGPVTPAPAPTPTRASLRVEVVVDGKTYAGTLREVVGPTGARPRGSAAAEEVVIEEAKPDLPPVPASVPAPALTPPAPEEEAAAKADPRPNYGALPSRYPATVEGLAALEAAIDAHPGGAKGLGLSLGLSPAAVLAHKRRTRVKLGLGAK